MDTETAKEMLEEAVEKDLWNIVKEQMYTYNSIPPSAILNIEKHKFQANVNIKQENSEE